MFVVHHVKCDRGVLGQLEVGGHCVNWFLANVNSVALLEHTICDMRKGFKNQ